MCNLLHKDQLHVSALFVGHLQVDTCIYVINYTYLHQHIVVLDKYISHSYLLL